MFNITGAFMQALQLYKTNTIAKNTANQNKLMEKGLEAQSLLEQAQKIKKTYTSMYERGVTHASTIK